MAKLSKDAKERIIISLTSDPVGKEVIRAIEEGDDVLSGNAYTNAPKARIVSTTDGSDYQDHRLDSIRPGSLA